MNKKTNQKTFRRNKAKTKLQNFVTTIVPEIFLYLYYKKKKETN